MESTDASGMMMRLTSLPGRPEKDRLQIDWVIPWKLGNQIFQMIMAAEMPPKVPPEPVSGVKTQEEGGS